MDNEILQTIENIYTHPRRYGIAQGWGVMPCHLLEEIGYSRRQLYRVLNRMVQEGRLVKVAPRKGYIPKMALKQPSSRII